MPCEASWRSRSAILLWNLEGITWLAVRRETYLVSTRVIDADAHDIELHYRAQFTRENPEEFLRRTNGDEISRNAQERFVSLSYRTPGRALGSAVHHSSAARF
jgi:hypothetical protein